MGSTIALACRERILVRLVNDLTGLDLLARLFDFFQHGFERCRAFHHDGLVLEGDVVGVDTCVSRFSETREARKHSLS